MKTKLLLAFLCLLSLHVGVEAQSSPKPTEHMDASSTERELRQFYDAYGEDLRRHRTEEIANRYDPRGYFSMGNGNKRFVTFEDNKKRYLTAWTGPKSFAWKDLSFEMLSPVSATVVGLFEWQTASGNRSTYSYTGVLTKQSGQWRIRVEDESSNPVGYTTKNISGDRNTPGLLKYSLTAEPGASISAHRHTSEMRIAVKSGRKFILMGDLENAKVQRFEAGSTFVIPANVWHVEWWETETVEEIEITAPTRTERATPASPRVL